MKYSIYIIVLVIFSVICFALDSSNILVYWKGDSNLLDSSGNNNNLNGTIQYTTGKLGNAFNFTGTDYLNASPFNLPGSPFTNANVKTVEYWVKYESIGTNRENLYFGDTAGTSDFFYFSHGSTSKQRASATATFITSPQAVTTDTWYHMVIVFNGEYGLTMYQNGSRMINDTAENDTLRNGSIHLGVDIGLSEFMHGQIDNIIFYNVSANDTDVATMWNSGQGWDPLPETTIPTITFINLTSDGGDITPPYKTSDRTPTFAITTDINANCRIGIEDKNYTTMGSGRQCTTTGTTSHICTVISNDTLSDLGNYVYMGCASIGGYQNTTSTSGPLEVLVDDLQTNLCGTMNNTLKFIPSINSSNLNLTTMSFTIYNSSPSNSSCSWTYNITTLYPTNISISINTTLPKMALYCANRTNVTSYPKLIANNSNSSFFFNCTMDFINVSVTNISSSIIPFNITVNTSA